MSTIFNTTITIEHVVGDGYGDGQGATYAQQPVVAVLLRAEGAPRAFILSEDPNFVGGIWKVWIPFESNLASTTYILSPAVSALGTQKRLYCAFSSNALDVGKQFSSSNVGGTYNDSFDPTTYCTDSVILDTTAPNSTGPVVAGVPSAVLINEGQTVIANNVVTIDSYVLGATEMRIAEVSSGFTFPPTALWFPYTPAVGGFVLSSGYGLKRVIAQYRDPAENVTAVYETTTHYSAAEPSYSILLNTGLANTYSRNIQVKITVLNFPTFADLHGVWVSEFANFAIRQEYGYPDLPTAVGTSYSYPFQLSNGSGLKTVYIRLYNSVGTYSTSTATIHLDQVTPAINASLVPDGKIVIVNPSTSSRPTNNPQVTVTFAGVQTARSVIISSNPDFSGASWAPLIYIQGSSAMPTYPHVIDASSQGIKYVYARFSDADEVGRIIDAVGNITQAYVGEILFDTEAPLVPLVLQPDGHTTYPNGIVINGGVATTVLQPTIVGGVTKFFLNLTLNASGATEMHLATHLVAGQIPLESPWISYVASMYYEVPRQVGLVSVFVQYRDEAGNLTGIQSDNIEVVDGLPIVPGPSGPYAFLINGGAAKTNLNIVTLTLNAAADPTLEVLISESDTFYGAAWQSYATTKSYTFKSPINESKTLFVKYRIKLAGIYYRESPAYNSSIVFDNTAPSLTNPIVLINGGITFTRNRLVSLVFNVDTTAIAMQIFNEIDYDPVTVGAAGWTPYANPKTWQLSLGNGQKNIYVRFKDDIGNITVFSSAGIVFNSDLPQAPVIASPASGSVLNQRMITLTGTAEPGALITVTVKPKG